MNDLFDQRRCELGEGAFWHPERQQFFWFDIVGNLLLSLEAGAPRQWQFEDNVSAAGWISGQELLVASETGLWRLDLVSGQREPVVAFPSEPRLRSNDGRADPWGGFWIGTMGKRSETEAGAIWRYYRALPAQRSFTVWRSLASIWGDHLRRADGHQPTARNGGHAT